MYTRTAADEARNRAAIAEQEADLAAGRLVRNPDGLTVSPTETYWDTPERQAIKAKIEGAKRLIRRGQTVRGA